MMRMMKVRKILMMDRRQVIGLMYQQTMNKSISIIARTYS